MPIAALPLPPHSWHQEFLNYYRFWDYTRILVNEAEKQIQQICPEKKLSLDFADNTLISRHVNQNKNMWLTNVWYKPELAAKMYYQQFEDSYYGAYYYPLSEIELTNIEPERDFNCFIARADIIRQSWLYQFIRRDMLNRGYVNFNQEIDRHIKYKLYPEGTTALEIFDDQFVKHLNIFQNEHDYIRSQIPYKNYDATDNLTNIVMRSKFSVILETYTHSNDFVTFSEKTFRCLRLPRPWLMFANKNSVQYLRDLGFDVLDDLVDHSYDNLEFDIDRQEAILDQINELSKLKFTEALKSRCQQAADHNQEILLNFCKQFHKDVNTTINTAIERCLS
jgi:hypothetical protein